ncbi:MULTISPECIES: hypothetical protein [Moraxella]|uniref:Uncharacterized protein n=1 Tax=Moraxella catarrhalis TaxID=480 RepID=A0A7Z1A4K3_MORCA|nr:hypothetical protein [Moraxella catarrhalis]OAV01408.1 hypothetical protein AO382_0683 [Moraxella catarrhalis]STY81694.1 Uncharacterised protein [Moraxella catarrhalis]
MSRNETFKIISHSEGGAYGAGMAQALIDKGYKVETLLRLNKKYYYNPNNGKFYEGKVENGF